MEWLCTGIQWSMILIKSKIWVSLEPLMKAGVLKNHSSLSNENKSEGTRILEMAIENTKSVVRPSGMPLALSYSKIHEGEWLAQLNYPVVLKREGQTTGKGMTISNNVSDFVQDAWSRYNASEDFYSLSKNTGKRFKELVITGGHH